MFPTTIGGVHSTDVSILNILKPKIIFFARFLSLSSLVVNLALKTSYTSKKKIETQSGIMKTHVLEQTQENS